jgi:Leucine-rich repeat (LRR) protein
MMQHEQEQHNSTAGVEMASVATTIDEMTDVNVDDLQYDGTSLPYPDALRASIPIHRKRRKFLVFGAGIAFVLTIFLAIYIPVSRKKRSSSAILSIRTLQALSYLRSYVDSTLLDDETSAQRKAAIWIANDDTRQVPLVNDNWLQRYALATLYFETSPWLDDLNFLDGDKSECEWNKLDRFDAETYIEVGILCDKQSEVNEIRLIGLDMIGSVPPEIKLLTSLSTVILASNQLTDLPSEMGTLSSLTTLFLDYNYFTTIPDSFSMLTNLQFFSMGYNHFQGNIPTLFGALTSLRILFMSNNKFSGELPTGLAQLSHLTTLALDDNDVEGELTVLENMTKLELLYLEDNAFSGSIDDNFLSKLKSLHTLDLSNNFFKGFLTQGLLRKENLTILDLSHNSLSGILPLDIPPTTGLKFLALQNNYLGGMLPANISNLVSLTHLDLSQTSLTGTLPNTLGLMTNLEYLFVAKNLELSNGTIPQWIGNLTKLKELSLKLTRRTGTIPDLLGNLTNLILLDLDQNSLTGSLPKSLGKLSNLHFLLVNRNKLNGTVPMSLSTLPLLTMVLLDQNNITNTSEFCNSLIATPLVLWADCGISCNCCTECCESSRVNCTDSELLADYNPIWENNYTRVEFNFSQTDNLIFVPVD